LDQLLEIRTIPPGTNPHPDNCGQPMGSARTTADRTRAATGITGVNTFAEDAGIRVMPANQDR